MTYSSDKYRRSFKTSMGEHKDYQRPFHLVQIVHMANAFSRSNPLKTLELAEIEGNIFELKSADIANIILQAEEETKTIARSLAISVAADPNQKLPLGFETKTL